MPDSADTSIGDTTTTEVPAAARRQGDPVRRWTLIVAALLVALLVLQIASDRTAPVTSIATVEGLIIPISSRVAGEIAWVEVADNQVVEQDQLLARIDPTPFRLAVEAAEAQLAGAGQSIGASTAGVAAAQAKLAERRAALVNARAQGERTLELVSRGVLAKAKGEEATAAVARSEADVAAAEAEVRRAEEALGPAGADNPQIRAAQASLETAQFNLEQTSIVSPTRGYVTNLRLGAGQTANPGQPFLTLIDLTGAWIVAYFRENQMENIRIGDRVEIALDIRPGEVLKGHVASFAGGVMTLNQNAQPGGLVQLPASGSWLTAPQRFAVRIEFDQDAGIPKSVRLGSQATIMVYTEHAGWLSPLWWLHVRAISLISYVY